jgi:hypothetical protein
LCVQYGRVLPHLPVGLRAGRPAIRPAWCKCLFLFDRRYVGGLVFPRIVLDVKKWRKLSVRSGELRWLVRPKGLARDSFLRAGLVPIMARLAPIRAAGHADALPEVVGRVLRRTGHWRSAGLLIPASAPKSGGSEETACAPTE